MSAPKSALTLFTPQEVRRKADYFLEQAAHGKLVHVDAAPERLKDALLDVLEVTRENYPDLQIPPYGAWRDFEAEGVDRWAALANARGFGTAEEMIVTAADLAFLASFMKTQVPRNWRFEDPMTQTIASGTEGSALAAFHMFASGSFSSDMSDPYRVDAETLIRMEEDEIASGLQWDLEEDADLIGAMQRHMKRFGEALALRPDLFSERQDTRPGILAVRLAREAEFAVSAVALLDHILEALAPVWDGGAASGDMAFGDSFLYAPLEAAEGDGIVPFHLPAQEMVYSLVEPFAWSGLEMSDLEALTAPSSAAHAALFVKHGALVIRDASFDLIGNGAQDRMIEIRAVAAALTEQLAYLLRRELDVTADQLPLSCILEGGTRRTGEGILEQASGNIQKLGKFLNPGAVFWLPFGA